MKRQYEIKAEIDNAVFPSKEDSGIEHVDMSYRQFMKLINELVALADKNSK